MRRLSICLTSFLLVLATCFSAAFGCANNSSGNSSGGSSGGSSSSSSSSSSGGGSSSSSSSSSSATENPDERVLLNSEVYLALSKDVTDETTSILYSVEGGPFRCNYMYVPDEQKRKGFNAVEFNIEIKTGGGYLFIVEGGNADISSAWGAEGGYTVAAAIGKDYFGKV